MRAGRPDHVAGTAGGIRDALAGRSRDLAIARTPKIIRICGCQGVPVLGDRACTGAGTHVTAGIKRPPGRELAPTQRTVNRALARATPPQSRAVWHG
ncbi:hypothetical protein TUSST3_54470 [Streptomyces sp. TUS-ST3]|nr:hypothetical protein TUSST3_54470 [Streptomyces sp. TUS-ST3]